MLGNWCSSEMFWAKSEVDRLDSPKTVVELSLHGSIPFNVSNHSATACYANYTSVRPLGCVIKEPFVILFPPVISIHWHCKSWLVPICS